MKCPGNCIMVFLSAFTIDNPGNTIKKNYLTIFELNTLNECEKKIQRNGIILSLTYSTIEFKTVAKIVYGRLAMIKIQLTFIN